MRVGGIYVDIRGDITQLKKDMDSARHIVRQAGTDISDSLNNALSPKQIEGQLNTLISNLGKAQRASKLTADAFDGVGVELKELQHITGISSDRFQKLQSQMLQTRAQQQAERAFNAIAKATNASTLQMAKLRIQMGDIQGGFNELRGSIGKAASSVLSLKNAFLGLGIGYIVKDLFEAGRSASQMQKAFIEITGSTKAATKEFDFLRDVADRLGQNFWDLQDSYKGLLAASKDTTIAGQATRDAFEAVTKASATLGLSSEKTERTIYALEQMISKGKISSEELRVQMGDQLPGAFGLAAKAMNMTTAELDAAMKAGEVFAEDFIPRFSKVLSEKYSGEVDKATSAVNKWNEALQDMKVQIAEAGFLDVMTKALREITEVISNKDFINNMALIAEGFARMVEGMAGVAKYVGLRSVFDTFNEGLELSQKGLVDFDEFVKSSFLDRQRMVDEGRKGFMIAINKQTEGWKEYKENVDKANDSIEKITKSTTRLTKAQEKQLKEQEKETKRISDILEKNYKKVIEDRLKAGEQEIKDRQKLLEKEEKDRQKSLEKISKQQEIMWESIQKETSDILFGFIDDYENAWDNLADTIFDIFKRMLADMAAQALMQPIIVPMVQQMQGMLGIGGGVPGATAGGGIGDIIGMGRQAFGLFGGGAGIAGGLGGAEVGIMAPAGAGGFGVGAGVQPLAQAAQAGGGIGLSSLLGAAGLGAAGYGMLAEPLGLPTSRYSGITAGLGSAGGLALSGIEALSFLGAAGGPLGIAGGALLGGLFGGLLGGEEKPHKFRTEYGLDIENILAEQLGDISPMRGWGGTEKGYEETRQKMEQQIDAIYTPQIEQLRSFIDVVAESGVDVENMLGDLASFSSLQIIKSRGHIEEGIEITMGRITDDFSQYSSDIISAILPAYIESIVGPLSEITQELEIGKDISQLLKDVEIGIDPENIQEIISQIIGLEQMVAARDAVFEILDITGQAFEGTTIEAIEFSQALIYMAGDLETLTNASATYYEAFFTDEEKHIDLMNSLSDILAQLNMTLPETRSEFRALVESLDLTTETGQSSYVALIKASDQADKYYTNIERVSERSYSNANRAYTNITSIQGDALKNAEKLASDKFDLEIQIMRLEGKELEALALIREKELESMDVSLRPLQERIWMLEDEAEKTNQLNSIIKGQLGLLSNLDPELFKEQKLEQISQRYANINEDLGVIFNTFDDAITYFTDPSNANAIQDYVNSIDGLDWDILSNDLVYLNEIIKEINDSVFNLQDAVDVFTPYLISTQQALFTAGGGTQSEWLMQYGRQRLAAGAEKPEIADLIGQWYQASINEAIDQATRMSEALSQAAESSEQMLKSIDDTISSLTFGALSVALPGEKFAAAGTQYQKLFQAAMTGDQAAVQEYLAFAPEYLQMAQDVYKSSGQYQTIFDSVQSDLETMREYVADGGYQDLMYQELIELNRGINFSDAAQTYLDTKIEDINQSIAAMAPYFEEQPLIPSIEKSISEMAAPEISAGNVNLLIGGTHVTGKLEDIQKKYGFANGGISTGPDSGHLELLHGTEAIIPLQNGSIPVELTNSGPQNINVVVEIDGEKISTKEIAMVADEIRVKASRRGIREKRLY